MLTPYVITTVTALRSIVAQPAALITMTMTAYKERKKMPEDKEIRKQMIAACMKSEKIQQMYDDYVIKEKVTFEKWVENNVNYLLDIPQQKPERLTIGMRARILPSSSWYHKDRLNEILLRERSSSGDFSFLELGQEELKKKDPKTCIGGGAWISEDELEFVDANYDANMDFIDWYTEHEDEFCGDCGAWFPNNGMVGEEGHEEARCPNDNCPGNRLADGCCPFCDDSPEFENDKCPKCGFKESVLRW